MKTSNLTKEQKDQVIGEFLDSISDWNDCFRLTQFVLMKLSKEAIKMNAGELALSQSMIYKGFNYKTRMSIQYQKEGFPNDLEERVSDMVDKLMDQYPNEPLEDLLNKAVLAGYNLHIEDFDDYDEQES